MFGKVQTTCGYNDLETCPEKMIQNSVSRKYGTDLHLVIASLIVLRAARAQAPAPPPAYPAAAPPALRWPPAHSAVPPPPQHNTPTGGPCWVPDKTRQASLAANGNILYKLTAQLMKDTAVCGSTSELTHDTKQRFHTTQRHHRQWHHGQISRNYIK